MIRLLLPTSSVRLLGRWSVRVHEQEDCAEPSISGEEEGCIPSQQRMYFRDGGRATFALHSMVGMRHEKDVVVSAADEIR